VLFLSGASYFVFVMLQLLISQNGLIYSTR